MSEKAIWDQCSGRNCEKGFCDIFGVRLSRYVCSQCEIPKLEMEIKKEYNERVDKILNKKEGN